MAVVSVFAGSARDVGGGGLGQTARNRGTGVME